MKKIILFVFIIVVLVYSHWYVTSNFERRLKTTPQDATTYLQPITADKAFFTNQEQTTLKQQYLCHYFSPWTGKCLLMDNANIKSQEIENINKFTTQPGWAANMHPHNREWINTVVDNMEISTFPNSHIKAITIRNSNLRELPSNEPSFKTQQDDSSDGYPFDLLQASYLPANTPVLLLQTSKDKVWDLVLTPNAVGWLPHEDINYVTNDFIQRWHTENYVAALKDNTIARLGVIYPLISTANDHYKILVTQASADHIAVIQTENLSKKYVAPLPVLATPKNIAIIANSLLGKPYGWGGMYGYRDCSATMMDLFAPFAIWLPRNSKQQLQTGKFISLANKSNEEKRLLIRKFGVPSLSLIGLKGHIVLYLGDKNDQLYVYQTMWGSHNMFGWRKSVVGRTVITPFVGGLLDKAIGVTMLLPGAEERTRTSTGRPTST